MADYDLQYQDTHIDALLATANELKTAGYIYKGVATPSTNPGTPTERVAYLASEPGTYTNFGGIVITSGLYSLTYAGGTWTGTQMQAGSDIAVVQTTGQSTSNVMSQKAVTDSLVGTAIAYDNTASGLAADNVQGVLDEMSNTPKFQKVKCERNFSLSAPRGETVDTHSIALVAGRRYKFEIKSSSAATLALGVRLHQTYDVSSNVLTIGIFPEGVSKYTCFYTPESSTNYQYLSFYKNQTTALDMDVIIYEYGDLNEKIADTDSISFLEKPFEQGTIGTDGTTLVDIDTLIRSADYIHIPCPVTLQAKDGYYIRRVFAYNPDGTLNALLNTDAVSSFILNDPIFKYKFTVQRGTLQETEINPNEDCMVWTPIKNLIGRGNTQGVAELNAGTKRVFVAAVDSIPAAKAIADYVCDGVNDEVEIQTAINSLTYGGTVQLLDGRYNIDAFPKPIDYGGGRIDHVAIFVAGTREISRVVNLIGTTENKSYNSHYGVHIHVTDTAIATMNDTDTYVCIQGTGNRPEEYGTYTRVTNMNFANFYLYIGEAQKKIIGINCKFFGGTYIKQVGVYTEGYFYYRFNHLKPPTPVEGSIGVVANSGANDEMARIGIDTLNCGGMYIGFLTQNDETPSAVDKMIMRTCTFGRCVYGMYFNTGTPKTMTLINCSDEGCTHLPYFGGSGHITALDLNIERFNNAYYPDDPTGNTEFYAVEETPGSWIGTIEYTLQGWSGANSGNTGEHFWKLDGSGKGIRTRNLNYDHTGYSQPNCGEYLERYFDTTNNVWKTWNGSAWV